MSTIKLEVCENAEWWCVFGPLSGITDDRDAVADACSNLHAKLTDLGFDTCSPKGQRILCHGWNGASLTHKLGPVGTFDDLTAGQIDLILTAVEECVSVVNECV